MNGVQSDLSWARKSTWKYTTQKFMRRKRGIPVPSEGVNFCPGLFFLVFQTGVDQNRPRQDATRQKTPFGR